MSPFDLGRWTPPPPKVHKLTVYRESFRNLSIKKWHNISSHLLKVSQMVLVQKHGCQKFTQNLGLLDACLPIPHEHVLAPVYSTCASRCRQYTCLHTAQDWCQPNKLASQHFWWFVTNKRNLLLATIDQLHCFTDILISIKVHLFNVEAKF